MTLSGVMRCLSRAWLLGNVFEVVVSWHKYCLNGKRYRRKNSEGPFTRNSGQEIDWLCHFRSQTLVIPLFPTLKKRFISALSNAYFDNVGERRKISEKHMNRKPWPLYRTVMLFPVSNVIRRPKSAFFHYGPLKECVQFSIEACKTRNVNSTLTGNCGRTIDQWRYFRSNAPSSGRNR